MFLKSLSIGNIGALGLLTTGPGRRKDALNRGRFRMLSSTPMQTSVKHVIQIKDRENIHFVIASVSTNKQASP